MDRITDSNLNSLVAQINLATGSPMRYAEDGPFKANVGHYHIDSAYGGVALERTVNEGGGVMVVLTRGTKRDLYERMQAWLAGYRAAKS